MGRAAGYIIAAALVIIALGGAAEMSTRTWSCMVCHTEQAEYACWMETKLKADKKGFSHELISCAACHIEGAAQGTIASRFRGVVHAAGYLVPQLDPRKAAEAGSFKRTRVPSENCKYCHLAALKRKTVRVRDLPPDVKKIGLRMDHAKHVSAGEATCARCHERYKDKQPGIADKTVNFAERNHIACDVCHTRASHAYKGSGLMVMTDKRFKKAKENAWKRLSKNPRWMVAFPDKTTCMRCHNGKIHYKTRIFQADCLGGKSFENCVKCHPVMTKEYFERYRKDRDKLTAAAHRVARAGEQEL